MRDHVGIGVLFAVGLLAACGGDDSAVDAGRDGGGGGGMDGGGGGIDGGPRPDAPGTDGGRVELPDAAVTDVGSCEQSDVQAAIDAAANGDIVRLPGGASCSCAWSGDVTIPSDKGITLDGNGCTIDGAIALAANDTTSSRITRFTFTAPDAIGTSGDTGSAPYRIDHNEFVSHDGGRTLLDVGSGNAPGLVDNNTFECPRNCEIIHNWGMGASDDSGWHDDVTPGGPGAVYIEDNQFTNNDPEFGTADPAYFWGSSSVQAYYGARTVFRYNHLLMSQIDQHGTAGMIGARWWEIYENTFDTGVPHASQCCFITLRAGSGVVWNNHHTGGANNGDSIDLYEEDTGYPADYQIGRGRDQSSDPAYLWGNDAFFSIGSQTPAMVQEDRDYFLMEKPGYVPFAYPYPLSAVGLPDP